MNPNTTLLSHLLIIFLTLFSIIYTFGIVWRVEKKLDIAFKLFLVAIISFAGSEIALFLPFQSAQFFSLLLQLIFAAFFLAGTLEMRSMIRRMDGEIKK